uniref:Uncharacterized protein n=1 Tax=Arundo donax TaxID=35708 RepID=A0A0A9HFT0_ARUDO
MPPKVRKMPKSTIIFDTASYPLSQKTFPPHIPNSKFELQNKANCNIKKEYSNS